MVVNQLGGLPLRSNVSNNMLIRHDFMYSYYDMFYILWESPIDNMILLCPHDEATIGHLHTGNVIPFHEWAYSLDRPM
jgi:hypothetical protein